MEASFFKISTLSLLLLLSSVHHVVAFAHLRRSSTLLLLLSPPPPTNHFVLLQQRVGRLSSSLRILSSVSHNIIPSHPSSSSFHRLLLLQLCANTVLGNENDDRNNNASDDASTQTNPTTPPPPKQQQHANHQLLILSRRSSFQQCIHTCLATTLLLSFTGTVASVPALVAAVAVVSDEKVQDDKTMLDDTGSSSSSSSSSNNSSSSPRNSKPYAPLENLLPATRVLVLINSAVEIAQALSNKQQQQQQLQTLQDLILNESKQPTTYFKTAAEATASKTYLQIDTWQTWNKARQSETMSTQSSFLLDSGGGQQQQQQGLSVIINRPFTSLNEAAEQWGERTQFSRLQKQQMALERKNPMRAAFNAYTNNLLFGDRYTLTADPAVKRRLIRDDRLPDVTSVVRSDLDLRDLYRNQVLTAWEDATAELEYQLERIKSSSSSSSSSSLSSSTTTAFDATELLGLLRQAQSSCQEWFKFVPEQDMKEALVVVQNEQRNQTS